MRLIRFGAPGAERPGLLLPDGTRVDASGFGEDWDERFLGSNGLSRLGAWSGEHLSRAPRIPASQRLGPPVARPSKIICIGLNYADHAEESGAAVPEQPVIFFKSTTALTGPDDDVVLPRGSTKTDWEVELAVVVGRRARYVPLGDAPSFVAGYVLHNDYSEREHQLERRGQWVKGKSADTFAPLGPFLATPDETGDVQRLDMWLSVNGKTRQKSSTANMIFGVAHLVHYVSQFMTLLPGDVISTGTPAGVGLGLKPPVYLKAGDVVECGIERLGRQRQRIVPST
jgi:2,4-didehydro-3-deoxy-L-rhamnonate hydrolase